MLLASLLACTGAPAPVALELALDGAWSTPAGSAVLPTYQRPPEGPFRHRIEVPAAWEGSEIDLLIAGTGWRVTASVDGVAVGSLSGGVAPGALALTSALTPGPHELELAVEGPRGDNIDPPNKRAPIAAWTDGEPRPGATMLRTAPRLLVHPRGRVTHLEARLTEASGGFQVEASAWGEALPAGASVAFRLVRDGAVLADLGTTAVDQAGLARLSRPWEGARWPDPEGLAWLVAEVGGARWQARVGLRSAVVDGAEVRLNGERRYLLAHRLSMSGLRGRLGIASGVDALAALGANAFELHGEVVPTVVFDAADELGIPIVYTPRCDGQRSRDGHPPEGPQLRDWYRARDDRLRDAVRHHPSILLWAMEAPAAMSNPAYPAYAVDDLPFVGHDAAGTLGDPSLPGDSPDAALYLELPWDVRGADGRTLGQRLREPLTRHLAQGLGLVLPALPSSGPGVAEARVELGELATSLGIPPWPRAERRGVSTVGVEVRRGGVAAEGVPVVLEVPEQPPVGAITGVDGVAWIELYYQGPALVRVPGTAVEADVVLVPGVWSPPRWTAGVARVGLTVE